MICYNIITRNMERVFSESYHRGIFLPSGTHIGVRKVKFKEANKVIGQIAHSWDGHYIKRD